ncbi:MAG TPA: glycosidase, partial [Chitinophaga sp.]|nr:glycosidase [Chitinophaga sp.]
MSNFHTRLQALQSAHQHLLQTTNKPMLPGNGIFLRYQHPVLTAAHVPLEWCYDLRPHANPYLMTRFGINA